jgi:hypothetical protein
MDVAHKRGALGPASAQQYFILQHVRDDSGEAGEEYKNPHTHRASDSAAFYIISVEFFHKPECW